MKKSISALLVIIMLLSLSACSGTTAPTATENPPVATETLAPTVAPPLSDNAEINRAAEYGFLPSEFQGDWDTAITYVQFCTMVGKMLALKDASFTPQWQKAASLALASDKKMLRQEGMLALFYAAQIMGIEGNGYSWGSLFDAIGEPWDNMTWNYPLFPDWKDKAVFDQEWKDRMTAAYFFSLSIQSPISSKLVFDYDEVSNSMRLSDAFTRKEAIQAVLRLYESTLSAVERTKGEWDTKFLSSADARRKAILGSETSVTYTGTAYYVSNSGRDSNDGKTESTAWATLDKVNSAKLKAGDAIFFQRGGLWRGTLRAQEGLTYSAYGTGDKPKLYTSPENGVGAGKWSVLEGTNNIWVYYKDTQAFGGMFFNGGEAYGVKQYPYFINNTFYSEEDPSVAFDVTKHLDCDLAFFTSGDCKANTDAYTKGEPTGKLYLRCDKGNPGEIYNSIEFSTVPFNVESADNCTFDNLCLKYGQCGFTYFHKGITIQNCEVAYIGGCVIWYEEDGSAIRGGDGITIGGSNNAAYNNYVHDTFDDGGSVEIVGDFQSTDKNLTFKGNLIENCNGGILVVNWFGDPEEGYSFENIVVEDNYIMYSGYCWSHEIHPEDLGSSCAGFTNMGQPNSSNGIYVRDNVFYLSKGALIYYPTKLEYTPEFSGNTYVQNTNGYLAVLNVEGERFTQYYGFSMTDVDDVVRDKIGDTTALVIK